MKLSFGITLTITLLLLFFFPFRAFSADRVEGFEPSNGLYFYSYEVGKEDRTSFHIPLSEIAGLGNTFSISFDFKIRTALQNFGYAFRIIGKNNVNLDLVIPDLRIGEHVSLIFANRTILRFKRNDIPGLAFDSWNNFQIYFTETHITMTLNGVTQSTEAPCDASSFQDMYFGANEHIDFFTTEVPPMTIKDIRFLNKRKEEICYWPLSKHAQNIAYDVHKSVKAYAVNPKWELDSHYNWEKKKDIIFQPFPQLAFDEDGERLFIVQDDKMLIYHVAQDELETVSGIAGNPYNTHPNQIMYDVNKDQLVSYNIPDNTLLTFDFKDKSWNFTDKEEQKSNYWHHSKYFIPEDRLLVTVGGYGYHKYRGVMMKYAFNDRQWTEVDISKKIFPRYLGSMGYLGEGRFLYFGGYGNESGNQEEYPRNFYDLYRIDTRTDSITKLWEQKPGPDEGHYTNSNSMVVDPEKGVFYLLSYANKLYNSSIQIKEFSIDKPGYKLVGDSIPYIFSDNRSYCDLFLCEKSGKLLAVTTHTRDVENDSNIEIYTINYRPYAKEDIYQEEKAEMSLLLKVLLIVLVVLVVFVPAGLFVRMRRKRKQDARIAESEGLAPVPAAKSSKPLTLDWLEDTPVEVLPSSIILLGGFQVIDAKGIDITKYFSPTLKSLFLLILLSTFKTGKGITSISLKNTFWFDKDDNSARNNRNVNLSKLRPILQQIGNVEINDDNSYWCVSMDKTVFCDYQSVMAICAKLDSDPEVNKSLLIELLRIAGRGLLLPNVHMDWVDNFKSEYSSTLIEILLKVSGRPEMKKEYELLSKAGDVILLHDNIDEDGIRLKCYGLYYSNRKGKALQAFNKFCEEYKTLLGEDYAGDFNDLVK